MNSASRFTLRKPKVHRTTYDAANEIPALNAATSIAAEYPAAALYEAEKGVGTDNSGGGRRANLKR